MKIKIKKITERIKNISELKCNIELEIRFKTYKSCTCLWNFICAHVNKILGGDAQYTAKAKNHWNKFAQPMISLNWSWIIIYYLHFKNKNKNGYCPIEGPQGAKSFIHQFKWTLCSRAIFSISGLCSRMFNVLRKEIKKHFF